MSTLFLGPPVPVTRHLPTCPQSVWLRVNGSILNIQRLRSYQESYISPDTDTTKGSRTILIYRVEGTCLSGEKSQTETVTSNDCPVSCLTTKKGSWRPGTVRLSEPTFKKLSTEPKRTLRINTPKVSHQGLVILVVKDLWTVFRYQSPGRGLGNFSLWDHHPMSLDEIVREVL